MAQSKTHTTNTIPAFIARTQFGQIMDRAIKEQARFVVSRNGEPAVVILAVEDFLENVIMKPEALAELQLQASRRGVDRLGLNEINAEIEDHRATKRKRGSA